MKYLSQLLVLAAVVLGLTACHVNLDSEMPEMPGEGEVPVQVTFSMADKAVQTRSKVSGTENVVRTMQLVCFDANGQYLGIRDANVESKGASGTFFDTGVIKGTVPQGTARIHFIANRGLSVPLSHSNGTSESVVMNSVELSTIWNDSDHQEICYWGFHGESTADAMNTWLQPAEGLNHVVYMIRDRAKVVLTYDPAGAEIEVTKIEWLIHNGRERGYLAPAEENWTNDGYYGNSTVDEDIISTASIHEYKTSGRYSLWTSESENDEDNFDVAYEKGSTTNTPQFLFEDDNTDADDVKVILRVTYTVDEESEESRTVYHTLRLNDNNKEKYDIVRNNTYYIKCKLLSPDVAYYETLKAACEGDEFVNADVEIDRSITDINDDDYTLQILLPTGTTAIVLNTEGNHDLDFAFRKVDDITEPGSTDPADFEVYWEREQPFCTAPTLSYVEETKQFMIHTAVIQGKLTGILQDEWIVVKHKTSGLTRYIHVFVINQFRYILDPKLTKVGDDYLLSFTIPPMEHTQFITDAGGNVIPDPNELIYPESLYPIDVKFATSTLNAYGNTQGSADYGMFGVSVENTNILCAVDSFESGFNSPISSTSTTDITRWYYQQAFNYWDYWYTYSLKTYPNDGVVNIYFKDVRNNIKYATVEDVGLFLYVEYFGKTYSVPLSTN